MRTIINILSYSMLVLFASCNSEFEPINYGKETCANCKMTIVDARFAAEMLTEKGRACKFDDVICMKLYAGYYADQSKNARYFISQYREKGSEFIDAKTAVYLHAPFFASPMSGNFAAFLNKESAKSLMDSVDAAIVSWENIR